MKINDMMKDLLEEHSINITDTIPPVKKFPIWRKADVSGRPYWGVSHFWSMDRSPVTAEKNLSWLEWDGNEIWLDARDKEDVAKILKKAIGIFSYWKAELEAEYPDTPFCLLASFDDGSMMEVDEGQLPSQSVTLRFWADRGDDALPTDPDFWGQPVMCEYCNYK